MTDTALIVFARRPEPGRVKTRLTPALSAADAALLYAAFVEDAKMQYASLDIPVRWYVAPSDTPDDPRGPGEEPIRIQRGDGLGERLATAFAETFADGFRAALVVGTDLPTLPIEFVSMAIETLRGPGQLVIGPSEDGGYYLLGMSRLYPAVFQHIVYSRSDVFEETMARAAHTDAEVTVLPYWHDIDTIDDVIRLAAELEGVNGPAPATWQALQGLAVRYPDLFSKGAP